MYVLHEQSYQGYIIRYMIILPMLWLYLSLRKDVGVEKYLSLFFCYSNTMVALAVLSLGMWILCSILQLVPATALIPFEWSSVTHFIPTYWGIYFETQSVTLGGEWIWRNSGIFNEGPMYNMALCTAFAINFFMRPSKSKISLWILAVTIITTFTTTGQFFLIGICGLTIYKQISHKFKPLIMVIVPILLLGSYSIADKIMEYKREIGGEKSINSRTEDIIFCLEAGIEHPVFGVGLVTNDKEVLWKGVKLGSSNSLFALFARGGLYVLIFYVSVILLIPFCYYRKYKDTRWLYVMFCFFFVFTVTSSYLKYLTYLFLAWGLSNIDLKRWVSYNKLH